MDDTNIKIVDETTSQQVQAEETNDNSSKLDADESKNTEELEKEIEKMKETLKKAEHTIVQLKKEKKEPIPIDIDKIKEDVSAKIKAEFEPVMSSIKNYDEIKRQNEELTKTITSLKSQSNSIEGNSVQSQEQKPTPTSNDVQMANKYFNGDIERYLKYKIKE